MINNTDKSINNLLLKYPLIVLFESIIFIFLVKQAFSFFFYILIFFTVIFLITIFNYKPEYGPYLLISSIIFEGFYISIFDANLKFPYIILFIFLIILFFRTIITYKISFRNNPFAGILGIFIILNLFSIMYSPSKLDTIKNFLLYLIFFLIFLVISSFVNSKKKLVNCVSMLIAVTIISCIIGMIQIISSIIFNNTFLPNQGSLEIVSGWSRLRVVGFFCEPDQFGKFSMCMFLFFLPLYSYKGKIDISKNIVGLALFLSLFSLILSQTRSAWLGAIAGLIIFLILPNLPFKLKIFSYIKLFFVSIFSVTLMYFLKKEIFESIFSRLYGIVDPIIGGASGVTRIVVTRRMFDLITASPFNIFFGLGSGSLNYYSRLLVYNGEWPEYMLGLGSFGFSFYLSIWFNIGLIGLAVILIFIIKYYKTSFLIARKCKNPFYVNIITGSVVMFTGMLVTSFVADSIHVSYFWVILGISSACLMLARGELVNESTISK